MKNIIIDAGHGGPDCGASNDRLGLYEKNITLAMAYEMPRWSLRGYQTTLTRLSDFFLSLEGRCKMANRADGDLFISLHANWFRDPEVRGIETYYYNGSNAGFRLAELIMDNLVDTVDVLNGSVKVVDRGEKPAGFYVLKYTKMPAVLVELGFISNDWQAEFMIDPDNQKAMAKAIWKGIEEYYAE